MYNNLFNLNNKVAVITGAGSGIGKEAAIILATYGAKVILLDIHEKNVTKVADQINQDLDENCAQAIILDVSKENDVKQEVKDIINQYEKIDILINNAGVMDKIPFEDMTLNQWQSVIDINLNSVFLLSQAVGKQMIKQKSGSIVNMASISSVIANKEPQSAYNVSKAGIHMLTKCLATEWAKYNIRVNSIAPGYTETGMTENLIKDASSESYNRILTDIPLNRTSQSSEIAGTILLLASDASSYTTGGFYTVDGGYLSY